MPVVRISQDKCLVTGKPVLSMSPDHYWARCEEGENPVFTSSGKPIAYCTQIGEVVYPSKLKIQEPVAPETTKKKEVPAKTEVVSVPASGIESEEAK